MATDRYQIQFRNIEKTVRDYGVLLVEGNDYFEPLERAFKLQRIQDRKAGLDGQARLVFGYEKPVVEAFVEVEA